ARAGGNIPSGVRRAASTGRGGCARPEAARGISRRSPNQASRSRSASRMTKPLRQDPPGKRPPSVLLLNHHQDDFAELAQALTGLGYQVHETRSLADSQRLLERLRPTVVVLNPLVPNAAGVEVDLVTALQNEHDPVPVLFLVEDPRVFPQVQRDAVPLADFALKPTRIDELRQRVERAVAMRQSFAALTARA